MLCVIFMSSYHSFHLFLFPYFSLQNCITDMMLSDKYIRIYLGWLSCCSNLPTFQRDLTLLASFLLRALPWWSGDGDRTSLWNISVFELHETAGSPWSFVEFCCYKDSRNKVNNNNNVYTSDFATWRQKSFSCSMSQNTVQFVVYLWEVWYGSTHTCIVCQYTVLLWSGQDWCIL